MSERALEPSMDIAPLLGRGPAVAACSHRLAAAAPVGWLRALRVRHWAHFLALPIGGIDSGLASHGARLSWLRGTLIAFAVLAFGYLLNSLADRHMDEGAGKNPFAAVPPRAQHARVLVALAAAALGLACFGPPAVLAATSLSLASGVVYSAGPRWKRVPGLGTALNATSFAPLLWVGLPDEPSPSLVPLTVAFCCLLLQNQLLHEAADRLEDARGGIRTSLRVLGPRRSALVAALLGCGLVLTAWRSPTLDWLQVPFGAVFVMGFPLLLALGGDDPALMGRARFAHRLSAMLSGAFVFVGLRS